MDDRRTFSVADVMPRSLDLYYGGDWHAAAKGGRQATLNPADNSALAEVAHGTVEDVELAVQAAQKGFAEWRKVPALERSKILKEIAARFRANADELACLDAANSGAPIREMVNDAHGAAAWYDFFAGLVTEIKGHSIPFDAHSVNYSLREPFGVVARIVAFNHPFMFSAGKMAAPLAAGNAVIVKAPEQAPLSALRLGELVGDLLPPGTVNVLAGGVEVGEALCTHPAIGMVTLVGSVPTGKAVMRSASSTLKPVILELGGKNALIAFPDADPSKVAQAAVAGMNFGWCGQSCGSTSRLFVHKDIHDAVLAEVVERIKFYKPGTPTDWQTTMGALVSRKQHDRVLDYIAKGKAQGATVAYGGAKPDDPGLANGNFILPTIFSDVTQDMAIASEEIFGPVLSVLKWEDEASMYADVNRLDYGLTCSVWTNDLHRAHRAATTVQAGYVWVNRVGTHFLGAPFGGYKQSGLGKENCLAELLAFTREKNVHIDFVPEGA